MAQTFHIEPDDDISQVVSKLSSYEDDVVNIVAPSGARIFQNIVDAYLLRDAVAESNQDVRIVTNDIMGRVFAERAGIKVVSGATESEESLPVAQASTSRVSDIVPKATLAAAKKKSSKKPSTASKPKKKPNKSSGSKKSSKADAATRFFQSYKESGVNGLNKISPPKKPRLAKRKISVPKISIVILGLAVVLLFFVFGKILPKAEAIIYPVRDPSSFSTEILVDQSQSSPDSDRGVIPGEILTSDQTETDQFRATGLENVNSKANGTITIFNEFSSSPQTFIPSRFQAEDGKIFWTTQTVTVPGSTSDGPGQVQAGVVAAEAGEDYNIGPTTFQMPALEGTPRFGKVYARSSATMEGGKIGEAVVVSQEDHNNALSSLRSRVRASLDGFRDTLPVDLILWEEAYNEEIVEESTTKEVGEPAENFQATLKITARAVVFKRSDLDNLLDEEINSRLSVEQKILPSSKAIEFLKPPVVDYQDGTILATLQVKADIIENMSTESFKKAILKKDREEIKQILPSFSGIERVEINLWPFWVKSVPSNSERVEVTIFGQ